MLAVYLGDDDSPSEPDFQYIPDTPSLASVGGDPLTASMTLLKDGLDTGTTVAQFDVCPYHVDRNVIIIIIAKLHGALLTNFRLLTLYYLWNDILSSSAFFTYTCFGLVYRISLNLIVLTLCLYFMHNLFFACKQ